jgi:hypothetical protein
MKMIYERGSYGFTCIVKESLNESTGESTKQYYIKGVFSRADEQPNRNGRIYPKWIWEREVKRFNEDHIKKNTKNCICRIEHPSYSEVDIFDKPVAKITKLELIGDEVIGEALILNNHYGQIVKSLIEAGIDEIGVSSRAVGEINENKVVEDLRLICYDVVNERSDFGITKGLHESLIVENGMVINKEYEVDPTTNEIKEVEICDIYGSNCKKYNQEDVEKEVINKFSELLNSFSKVKTDKTVKTD